MQNKYIIRPAIPDEADQLTELAFFSKGHWGYSKKWLESWRNELTVTPELIMNSIAFVAEFDGKIVGFWCRSIPKSQDLSPGMAENYFNDSRFDSDYMKIKPEQWESLLDQLARAA